MMTLLNPATASAVLDAPLFALGAGVLASLVGGAIGGLMTGGKALGGKLAAYLGGFYGPIAGVPGVIFGLLATQYLI